MQIRIKTLPNAKEFDEYDLSRFSVGEVYKVSPRLASLLIVGGAVFGGTLPVVFQSYPLAPCIPIFAWAAFRFGQREAASATFEEPSRVMTRIEMVMSWLGRNSPLPATTLRSG